MSITAGGQKSGGTKCCRSAHECAAGWSGNVSHDPILAEISVLALSAERPCLAIAAFVECNRQRRCSFAVHLSGYRTVCIFMHQGRIHSVGRWGPVSLDAA